MRNLFLLAAIVATFPLFAQSSRVFASKQVTKKTEGGQFQVNCKQGFAIDCYKTYMRSFTTKKTSSGEYLTTGLGGTIKASFSENGTETTVDVIVENAAFPSLAFNLKNYIESELLRDTFRQQKRILEGLVTRKAATERDNVQLERKIERLKIDIANAETKIILNNGAIIKYEKTIIQQQGLVNEIQQQIDDLLKDLPTK